MIDLLVRAVVAVCLFVVFRWLIPALFALLRVGIPDDVATALALLVAVVVAFWAVLPAVHWPWQKSA